MNDLGDTVTSDGKCTLREAINNANGDSDTTSGDCVSGSGVDTITFSVSGTIALTSLTPHLDITDTEALTIDSKGRSVILQTEEGMDRVFTVNSGSTLKLNALTLSGNGPNGSAAGILNHGSLNVSNSTFIGFGGGIDSSGAITNTGTLLVVNSTFLRNHGGRGMTNSGTATVINSTFFEFAGSIYNASSGTLYMRNTILMFVNPVFQIHDCDNDGTIAENVHNWIEDGSCNPYISGGGYALGNNYGDHGGPTPTLALPADSPAIDQGDPATCASEPVNNLDQRGFVRPIDGNGDNTPACDIGAFEYNSYPPIEASMDIQFCGNPNAFSCKKKGVVPVTLFGAVGLDVNEVNLSTVQLCLASNTDECIGLVDASFPQDRGNPATDLGTNACRGGIANPDGLQDMDLLFSAAQLADLINCGSLSKGAASPALIVKGQLNDGTEFRSSAQNNIGIDELLIQAR